MKKIKLLALVVAVVTGLLLFLFLRALSKPKEAPKTNVVVAAVDIPSNTTIKAEMIVITPLPNEAVHKDAITDPAQVIGKVFNVDVTAGEQIIREKLVKVGDSDNKSLAYAIEPGMRAISIGVDEVGGLAGMLKPGNRIDIISQIDGGTVTKSADGSTKTNTGTTAKMLLQNVKVLAVDSVLSPKGKAPGEDGKSSLYATVTLQVNPSQAVTLTFAANVGKLRMVLRSPVDNKEVSLPVVNLENVFAN